MKMDAIVKNSPRAVIRKLCTAAAATSHGVLPLRFLKHGSAPRSTSIFTSRSCPTMAASKIKYNTIHLVESSAMKGVS